MAKKTLGLACPTCGKAMNGAEPWCNCNPIKIILHRPNKADEDSLSRALLHAAEKAFADPEFMAEFERQRSAKAMG